MEAREHTLDVAGRRLAVVEWEGATGGTPLLILWGPEHHEAWSRLAARLAEERRVVALEASSAAEAGAAADALGLAYCALLGTAEAGAIAYRLVAHAPGRLERAVIVDAAIEGLEPSGGGSDSAVERSFEAARAAAPAVEASESRPDPDQIIVPVLLVHGAASPVSLDEMRRLAEEVEGATLVEVQSLAHPLPEGNPEALLAALREFLG